MRPRLPEQFRSPAVRARLRSQQVDSTPAYAHSQSAVEREIVKLENQWRSAIQKKDLTTLEKLMATEYTYISSGGGVRTKAENDSSECGVFEL